MTQLPPIMYADTYFFTKLKHSGENKNYEIYHKRKNIN